jgi:hypothetical protein
LRFDVEELAGPQGKRDRMHEVEAGHRLVGHLGVDADHLAVLKMSAWATVARNESPRGSSGARSACRVPRA